jgi:hypothetical protein
MTEQQKKNFGAIRIGRLRKLKKTIKQIEIAQSESGGKLVKPDEED